MPRSQTVGLNIGPDAREALRQLTYRLIGETGRRITLSEALAAACRVALADSAATVAALSATTETEGETNDETG